MPLSRTLAEALRHIADELDSGNERDGRILQQLGEIKNTMQELLSRVNDVLRDSQQLQERLDDRAIPERPHA